MNEVFDVIIVGGGSVGVGLLRDLSLHGIKTLLLEQHDFSSQTSQNSSKMLHGGIRYLENLDLLLVREALHEKNFWIKMAPHLVTESPFYMPIFDDSKYPLWMTSIGLKTYDTLSGFKNKRHQILRSAEVKQKFPSIKTNGLKGAGLYYDAIVDDHKLILECLYDATLEDHCKALNYHQVNSFKKQNNHYEIITKNTLTNEEFQYSGKKIIFATGPFTDQLLTNSFKLEWSPKMLLSKGSHIWLKKSTLNINYPLVMQTKDNRVVFVIPQDRGTLVGTTEEAVDSKILNIKASEKEIKYLITTINNYFPSVEISASDILCSFSGVRPLVAQSGKNSHKASRHHKVYTIDNNISVIIGGKYTTFRVMGKKLCKKIINEIGKEYDPKKTLASLRKKSCITRPFEINTMNENDIKSILKNEYVKTFEDLVIRRLSISSKEMWNHLVETPFDFFFKKHIELINRYIKLDFEDIKNF